MLDFSLLVTGPDGRYRPGLGDPSCFGWFVVLAYAIAAYLAYAARSAARRRAGLVALGESRIADERLLVRTWGTVCGLMIALGINKQLDLQTLFIQIARDFSRETGWYEDRRRYQIAFVVGVAALGALLALVTTMRLRRVVPRLRGCVAGLTLLLVFVVARAASFHHIDAFLGGAGALNPILELLGIVLVSRSASRDAERPTSITR